MPNNRKEEKYISLLEAARIYGCTQKHMALMAREKKLRAVKLGRNWFTTIDWLKEYNKAVEENNKKRQIEKAPVKKVIFTPQVKSVFRKAIAASLISLVVFAFISTAYIAAKEGSLSLAPLEQIIDKLNNLDFQSSNLASIRAFNFVRPLYEKYLASVFDNLKPIYQPIYSKVIKPVAIDISNTVQTVIRGYNKTKQDVFAFIDNLFTKSGNFVVNLISNTSRSVIKGPSSFGKFVVNTFQNLPQSLKKFFTLEPFAFGFPTPDISEQSFITIKDLYKKLSKLRKELGEIERGEIIIPEPGDIIQHITVVKKIEDIDQETLDELKISILAEVDAKISAIEITDFESMTFHYGSLWANIGSFSTALGVGGFFSATGPVTLGDGSEEVIVNATNWDVDDSGNITTGGDISLASLTASGDITASGDLTVSGNITGSSTLAISGQATFTGAPSGTTVSEGSVYINPSTASSSYTLFGVAVGGTEKLRLDAEGDLFVVGSLSAASTSFDELALDKIPTATSDPVLLMQPTNVSGSWATGSATFLGINASSSFAGNFADFRIDNTSKFFIDEAGNLGAAGVGQFGGIATLSYSRFGIATTSYSLTDSDDLLVSGMLEVDEGAWFDSTVSISGDFEIGDTLLFADVGAGHLAIGTDTIDGGANPPLYIEGTGGTEVHIKENSADYYSALVFGNDSGTWMSGIWLNSSNYTAFGPANAFEIYNSFDAPITFYTNATEQMRLTGGGLVGINDADPDAMLEIDDNDSSSMLFAITSSSDGDYFVVKNDGKVGIGTANPDRNLQIEGATNPLVSIKDSTSSINTIIGSDDSRGFMGTLTNNNLDIRTNNTARMTIDNSGNVGISDTDPDAKFEIVASTSVDDYYLMITEEDQSDGGILTIASTGYVGIGTRSPSTELHLSGTTPFFTIESDADNTDMGIYLKENGGNNMGTFWYDGSESVLMIETFGTSRDISMDPGDGGVGIGTTSPGARMEVKVASQGDVGLMVGRGGTDLTSNLIVDTDTDHTRYELAYNDYHHKFFTRTDVGATSERFTIEGGAATANVYFQNSNVGIGTTSPTEKLNIIGDLVVASNDDGISANTQFTILGAGGASMDLITRDSAIGVGDDLGTIEFRGTHSGTYASSVGAFIRAEAESSVWQGETQYDQPTALQFFTQSEGGTDGLASPSMVIDNAGNVGIGTTSPASALHIDATAPEITLQPNADTDIQRIVFGRAADGNDRGRINYVVDTNYMSFETNAVEAMRIDSSGNIGISDTTPDAQFEIVASTSVDDYYLMITEEDSTDGGILTIASTGYVGIGTAGPGALLHTSKDDASAFSTGSPTAHIKVENTNVTNNSFSNIWFRAGNADAFINTIKISNNVSDLAFITDTVSGIVERMRITSDGSVGIGNATPDAKFDVAGSGIFDNELIVGEALTVGYTTSAAYSQFGSGAMDYGLNAADDVLIAGDLEVDGDVYFDGSTYFGSVSSISGTLEITTDGTINDQLKLTDSSTSPNKTFSIRVNDGDFQIVDTSTVRMHIASSSGNVGIGTTGPAGILDVQDGTGTQTAGDLMVDGSNHIVYVGQLDATTGNTQFIVRDRLGAIAFSIDPAGAGDIYFDNLAAGYGVGIQDTTPEGLLEISEDGAGDDLLLISSTENADGDLLIVKNSGYIGIGTTGPDNLLHVYNGDSGGSSYSTADLTIEDDENAVIQFLSPNTALQGFLFGDPESNIIGQITYSHPANTLTMSAATGANTLVLDGSGNVGIGTTSPVALLDVVGGNVYISDSSDLGSELVTNGGLDSDTSGWIAGHVSTITWGAGYGYSGGGISWTDATAPQASFVAPVITHVEGARYKMSIKMKSVGTTSVDLSSVPSGWSFSFKNSAAVSKGTDYSSISVTSLGSDWYEWSRTFTALVSESTGRIYIYTGAWNTDYEVYVDEASIKEVTGGDLITRGLLTGGGSSGIKIKANGYVGIGATGPSALLDVGGGTATNVDGTDDLLIKDDLEVDGQAWFESTVSVSGKFEALANITLGDADTDLLVVNADIASNLIPNDNTRYIGDSDSRWSYGYFDELNVTSMSADGTTISGTKTEAFTINSDNESEDIEDAWLTFERGAPETNASLKWDSTNDRFNFNFPVEIEDNDVNTELFAVTSSSVGDYFVVKNDGNVGIGETNPGRSLEIVSPAGVDLAYWKSGANDAASTFLIRNSDNTDLFDLDADGDLYLIGDVGIGASTPNAAFHLVDSSGELTMKKHVTDSITIGTNTTDGSDTDAIFLSSHLDGLSTGRGAWIGLYGADHATNPNRFKISADPILLMDGNVGIGTTNPSSSFHIYDNEAIGSYRDTYAGGIIEDTDGRLQIRSSDDGTYGSGIILSTADKSWVMRTLTSGGGNNFQIGYRTSSADEAILDAITELFTIVSSGNVGIGTVSPGNLLHVEGTANEGILMKSTGADSVPSLQIENDAKQWKIKVDGTQDDAFIVRETGVADHFTILKTTGNVGIGDTDPDAMLEIDDNDSSSMLFAITSSSDGDYFVVKNDGKVGINNTNPSQVLDVAGNIDVSAGQIFLDATKGIYFDGGSDTVIAETSADVLAFVVGGATMMTLTEAATDIINMDANVGIGDTDPDAKFEIVASTSVDNYYLMITEEDATDGGILTIASTGYVGIGTTSPAVKLDIESPKNQAGIILRSSTGLSQDDYQDISFFDTATETAKIRSYVNSAAGGEEGLSFWVFDNPTLSAAMTILGSGNVGIGTTSPDSLLDVDGNILASSSANVDLTLRSSSATGEDGKFTIRSASSNDRLDILNNTTELMTIASTGYVGIGTTSPAAELDVRGTAIQLFNQVHGANALLYLNAENDAGTGKYFVLQQDPDDATNGQLNIIPNSTTSSNAAISIESGGNVGIGDSTPAEGKLVVAGTIYATTQATGVNEAVLGGRTLTAGTGLTGTGNLTANRTFNVGGGTCITANADNVAVTANCIDDAQVVDNGLDATSLAAGSITVAGGELDAGYAGAGLAGGGASALAVGGGTCITANANDVAVTGNCIGNTQLEFDTGQALTTGSSPSFVDLALTGGDLTMTPDGPDAWIADTFAANTYKNYISFSAGTGSNDPGAILHETSGTETNEGVLHLMPSDDNSDGDYVSIHGTNDPDTLKLHTSGKIEGVTTLSASGTITAATLNTGPGAFELYGRLADLVAGTGIGGGGNDKLYGVDADVTLTVAGGTCLDAEADGLRVTAAGCKTNWDDAFTHITTDVIETIGQWQSECADCVQTSDIGDILDASHITDIYVFNTGDSITGDLTITVGDQLHTDFIGGLGSQLGIGAGEMEGELEANLGTAEIIWLGAENGVKIVSSPDNMASGWAGRNEATLVDTSGNSSFPGNISATGALAGTTLNTGPGAFELYGRLADLVAGTGIGGGGNDKLYGVDADVTLNFDCSEVEGTGINCAVEAITLDATGDWTGTLDTLNAADFLRSNAADTLTATMKVTGSIIHEESSAAGYIAHPDGGYYASSSSSETGGIRVCTPVDATSDMVRFTVDVYDYTTDESFSVNVGGYIYQTAGADEWINEFATIIADNTNRNFNVRFGHEGGVHCIYIGETTSTWSYPQVVVRDFYAGYTSDIDAYDDGWSVAIDATFSNVDETQSANFPKASDVVCTDCLNATEIENIYVLNTSDTMSGTLGVGSTLTVTGVTNANGGLSQDANVILNGTDTWLRTTGATGWYSSTYSVGWYATEAGKVKPYNNAALDMNNQEITNIDWANSDDGAGSGLDADLLDGIHLGPTANTTANRVVRTNASGYTYIGDFYFRDTGANELSVYDSTNNQFLIFDEASSPDIWEQSLTYQFEQGTLYQIVASSDIDHIYLEKDASGNYYSNGTFTSSIHNYSELGGTGDFIQFRTVTELPFSTSMTAHVQVSDDNFSTIKDSITLELTDDLQTLDISSLVNAKSVRVKLDFQTEDTSVTPHLIFFEVWADIIESETFLTSNLTPDTVFDEPDPSQTIQTNEALFIDPESGFVEIGTASLSYKFIVNGTTSISEDLYVGNKVCLGETCITEENLKIFLGLNIASSSGDDNITITYSTGPIGFLASLIDGLEELGVTIKDGIIKAAKLVVDEVKTKILRANTISITVEQGKDNVVGTATIPRDSMEYQVENSLVEENSKIFVSFTSNTAGRTWYVSEKTLGIGFTIRLSEVTTKPLDFDYWIVLVEGTETTNDVDINNSDIVVPEPQPEVASESEPVVPETLPETASQSEPIIEEPVVEEPVEEQPIEEPQPEPEPEPEPIIEEPSSEPAPEPELEPEPSTEETTI